MKVDQTFLRDVQRHGWRIEAVTSDACIVACPTPGCSLRAKLRANSAIPARVDADWSPGIPIEVFADGLSLLMLRRKTLRLAIDETEHAAGMAVDHLAKIENGTRIPNVDTFLNLCAALGFEVILRNKELPRPTLAMIAQTRDREQSRARRFSRPVRVLPRRLALPSPG